MIPKKKEESSDSTTKDKLIEKESAEKKTSIEKPPKEKTTEEIINELKTDNELKLKDKDKIIEDWEKKFMILLADFENYQKRIEKNRIHLQNVVRASILRDLLKIMDSFETAIRHVENNPTTNSEDIKSLYNQFLNWFKSYNVEPIPTLKGDIFDYKIHESISYLENPDLPENSIIDVVQTGWKIGKEILRYAKVVISKIPKEPEQEETEEKIENEEEVREEIKVENSEKNSKNNNNI